MRILLLRFPFGPSLLDETPSFEAIACCKGEFLDMDEDLHRDMRLYVMIYLSNRSCSVVRLCDTWSWHLTACGPGKLPSACSGDTCLQFDSYIFHPALSLGKSIVHMDKYVY